MRRQRALRLSVPQLEALLEATLQITRSPDRATTLASILDLSLGLGGADFASIVLLDPSGQTLRHEAARGPYAHLVEGLVIPVGQGLTGLAAQTGETFNVPELEREPRYHRRVVSETGGMRSALIIPLRGQTRVIGVLVALHRQPAYFTAARERLLLVLADQAGRAIEYAEEYAERRRWEVVIEHAAHHDALTGLSNRSLFQMRLGEEIVAGGGKRQLALLIMDLDRFKEVNDTFGHHVGDDLLRQIAPRLRAAVRESDTVARLGGDEFAVLLPAIDRQGAWEVAHRLRHALEAPFTLDAGGFTCTISVSGSIGIALGPDHGTDAHTLLRCADVAMYVAKRTGRGQAVYSSTEDLHRLTRLRLLHQAPDNPAASPSGRDTNDHLPDPSREEPSAG